MMEQYLLIEFWRPFIQKVVRITLILIGIGAGFHLIRLMIGRFFKKGGNGQSVLGEKRANTLSGLVESIIRYAFLFFAIVMILEELHVDTTSVITSAGVIGLAVGIGAQSIVKDFIAGFFIIWEDQYAVGDYITSGSLEGRVEEISFRVTKLRDGSGILHVLPNGSISRVSNFNRGIIMSTVSVPVTYQADIKQMMGLLQQVCRDFRQEYPGLSREPEIVGITEFLKGYMTIRILVQSTPLTQSTSEAALRYKIRVFLQESNIPLKWLAYGPEVENQPSHSVGLEESPGSVARYEPKAKLDDDNIPAEAKNLIGS